MNTATTLVVPKPSTGVVVDGLAIELAASGTAVVSDIGFTIPPGTILGLVGESGSGKTTVGLGLLGHARQGLRITDGSVRVDGVSLLNLSRTARRKAWGSLVSYVPQDPASSLNPALRIRTQLQEIIEAHQDTTPADVLLRVRQLMREVALPDTDDFLRRYPHQLSGGQQQRIGIAMAFANLPKLVVLDEPTTGLDVTTQSHVLETIRTLASLHSVCGLYVSHDLAVVSQLAQRVAVMYAGRIVELGDTEDIFLNPQHPYTARLIAAAPDMTGNRTLRGIAGHAPSPGSRPIGCTFAPRCSLRTIECESSIPDLVKVGLKQHAARCIHANQVSNLRRHTTRGSQIDDLLDPSNRVLSINNFSAHYRHRIVVSDVDLDLARGECVALVGESGSGKTTTARSIAGLHRAWTGSIQLNGQYLEKASRQRSPQNRQSIQYVFQNPYGSLNPRHTVERIISTPLATFKISTGSESRRRVAEMLERVSLSSSYARKVPNQLSGGERQRVAIARALVGNPTVLVCDEVTSALDVSVQAAIIELLRDLRNDLGVSMLFVTHNLPLVASIAQRVAVMSNGQIVELGATSQVLGTPSCSATQQLLANTPALLSSAHR